MESLDGFGNITAKQLRIGNIISAKNADETIGKGRVTSIQEAGVTLDRTLQGKPAQGNLIRFHELSPVTLAPEIFRSAGFQFSNVHLWYQNDEDFVISHHKDGSFYCPFIEQIESPVVKSLHELQNLYFALTAKELEVRC